MALRAGVSAVLLGFLLSRVHLGSVFATGDNDTLPLLAVGLAVWLASIVLATVRWQRVLSALDLPSPLPPLLSHGLAGLFVANFLPSTVGGDVVRVVRLAGDNGQAAASFAPSPSTASPASWSCRSSR
ncbi:MAG TPA: lysylphosphatidylglycerol synthase domain-containing protein [Acidimicrobiales bacterium]|nr:lysylphosphatidylglycerol synthase domain-containing protein [Acidimicrobiales bacterium]